MSDFLQGLKEVKLRNVKSEDIKDYSNPKLAGFITKESIENYQTNVLDCNFENWYEKLKDVTFRTEFCPFEIKHAKLFIDFYEIWETNKIDDWKKLLTIEQAEILTELELKLDEVIEKFVKNSEDFVFVKTSSRSAKDSPLTYKNFQILYSKYLDELKQEDKNNENEQIFCLLKAAFDCLRVKNASQVLEMFCKSERIYQDMLLAIQKEERFVENFIIREFVHIDVDMEFRGFVYDGRLTALSQYNYLIYSKRLEERKKEIELFIRNFFDRKVMPKLDKFIKNFIIDFALVNDGSECYVIEINPFLETTDGALFSWQHEKSILESRDGFCFRIVDRSKPGAKAMLPNSIRCLMNV